jgi:NADH-quinone oxidoreductase subunit C
MTEVHESLADSLVARFGERLQRVESRCGELTYELDAPAIRDVARALHDEPAWAFAQLIDLSGVDYLDFGRDEWNTHSATSSGFSRGVERVEREVPAQPTRRFMVGYHLLSITHNRRLRLRAWCEPGEPPLIDSVIDIWKSADWYEREAFDLYGIVFRGHPDLRRLLTDYGFIGHPFRKDFPLSGNVEVRYDPAKGRVVYEPVSIAPRTLVPRVIRDDNRYAAALKDVPPNA